jgi:hypothetical protein
VGHLPGELVHPAKYSSIVSRKLDPVVNKVLSSPGELAWGRGRPAPTPLRSELRQLVYQALVD